MSDKLVRYTEDDDEGLMRTSYSVDPAGGWVEAEQAEEIVRGLEEELAKERTAVNRLAHHIAIVRADAYSMRQEMDAASATVDEVHKNR